jgi:hypothetical protein
MRGSSRKVIQMYTIHRNNPPKGKLKSVNGRYMHACYQFVPRFPLLSLKPALAPVGS